MYLIYTSNKSDATMSCKHCISIAAAREPVTPNSGSQGVCSDTVRDFWSSPFSSLHSHHGPPGVQCFLPFTTRQVQRRESQAEKRWLIIRASRTQRTSAGCLQAKANNSRISKHTTCQSSSAGKGRKHDAITKLVGGGREVVLKTHGYLVKCGQRWIRQMRNVSSFSSCG